MRLTPNYNLKKPEDHEVFDQQAHANANMDVIDAGLKANADTASLAAAGVAAVQADLSAVKGAGHSGETVKGVADAIAAHQAETAPHSATSSATAGTLMHRDASGRAKVAAPLASDDIARKAEVDAHATAIAHRYARQFLLMGG